MTPETAGSTGPSTPPVTAASVVSRLGEIRQRWPEANPDAHDPTEAVVQLVAFDVPWLLETVEAALADRDRARDLAAALEAENARLLNPNPHVPFAASVGGYPTTSQDQQEATT